MDVGEECLGPYVRLHVATTWLELLFCPLIYAQEEGEWPKVEVLVLDQRLIVTLGAIERQAIEVEVAVAGVVH